VKARAVILRKSLHQRRLWAALVAVGALVALAPSAAQARTHHSDAWAREHFATAERMREALNGRPVQERTRREYQRVLNAYRSIYLGAPASAKADPSVVAVAETLVEMGRRFDDDKVLSAAIEQYKFLSREYPGSKYRFDGLFTIGEIYKDDLNNPAAARITFQEFVKRYPHNRLAGDAQQAILELEKNPQLEGVGKSQKAGNKQPSSKDVKSAVAAKGKDNAKRNPSETPTVASSKAIDPGEEADNKSDEHPGSRSRDAEDRDKDQVATGSAEHSSKNLARVTGIRHWSTPDYSRVAIDVEGDVKFVSRRIDRPARIFFDLPGTKLASTLVGKSFEGDGVFLKEIRVAEAGPGRTRVVLEVDSLSDYDAFLLPNPYRLIIDIHGKDDGAKRPPVKDPNQIVTADASLTKMPRTLSTSDETDSDASKKTEPVAAARPTTTVVTKVVDADDADIVSRSGLTRRKAPVPKKQPAAEATVAVKQPTEVDFETSDLGIREAKPTASGDRSLIRALGLKIGKIVIDAGHGGHDTGTIGPNGLEEKDLVLEVSRRLGKLLETRLGAQVVYTRKDDTFIPLETRTAIANKARADLFISVHANSSHDPDARGVETYYLNFTSSPGALEVAARENAVSEKSIYELRDLVKKIALKEKIEESREFAGDVQQSLHSGLAAKSPDIRDRGVKKAPFIVLIGANMPSILAEISFVSNPADERRLATSEYRERIAESLYRGIAKYVNGLSGVKVASKMEKSAGQ
jgi:N-acetylmuramoyl-L-alanine amidase